MINEMDRAILREKAKIVRELSLQDSNIAKKQRWYDVNNLKKDAKPVFMTHLWQISTPQIFPKATTITCQDPMAKRYEQYLNEKIYYATVINDDNVIEPVIAYPLDYHMIDYPDLKVNKRWLADDVNHTGAAEFVPAIIEYDDINKIGDPQLHYNEKQTEENRAQALDIFGDILEVVKYPVTFAAKISDEFSWLRGIEQLYIDMYDDPEWVHEGLQRIYDNYIKRFHLVEEAGIWGSSMGSDPLGSAGLRFVDGLSDWRDVDDPSTYAPKLNDSWGFSCAEACTVVSGAMHEEFSFKYDKEIMKLFKYINVGCCEVLDKKIDLVKGFDNVRKISVSEWCDVENAARQIKGDYVYSYRAAGVPFVGDPWDMACAQREIEAVVSSAHEHGCPLEIVLNIGGTFGAGEPRKKLLEWSNMVRETIGRHY